MSEYLYYVGGIVVNPDNSGVRMKINYLCGNYLIGVCEWMQAPCPAVLNISTGAVTIYDHDPQGVCSWFTGHNPDQLTAKDVSDYLDVEGVPDDALIVKGRTKGVIQSLIPVLARHQVAGTDIVKGLKARGFKQIPKFTRLHSGGWDIRYPDPGFVCDWNGSRTLGDLNQELIHEENKLMEMINTLDDQPAETEEDGES